MTPAAQPVLMCQPAPVAGSIDTSVNDHAVLPQLLIVTLAVVSLPTSALPNSSV
jgi:hypothetical protein